MAAAASTELLSYEPDHIAERSGLFTLIVLGESVVGTVAALDTRSETVAVLVAADGLVIATAIWWLYFDRWRGMPGRSIRAGVARRKRRPDAIVALRAVAATTFSGSRSSGAGIRPGS